MPTTPEFDLTYPPPTGVAPDVPYYMQQLAEDVETALLPARQPAHALARPTAVQSIPDTTTTRIVLGTTVSSDRVTVNLAAGTMTITEAGLYLVTAGVGFAAGGTGYRQATLVQGSTAIAAQTHPGHTPGGNFLNLSALVPAIVGSVFGLDVNQFQGASLNTFGFADRTFLSVLRVGD